MNRFGGKAIAVAVVAAAGVLVTTPSAPARVVAATPPQSVTLTGSQTLVTTSAGRHLTLQIEAIKQVGAQQLGAHSAGAQQLGTPQVGAQSLQPPWPSASRSLPARRGTTARRIAGGSTSTVRICPGTVPPAAPG